MPITAAEAFEKRQITREDGINVLPRSLITVAALEAGYCLPSPTVDEAVTATKYPGQMTCQEFADFCEQHQESFVSARELAKAVVVIAPSNVITRGSLEEIFSRCSNPSSALTEEEVDALFNTLDTENKGAIDAEDFMRALHGDEGVLCLHEQRHADAKEAKIRIAEAEREAAERAEQERLAEEERLRLEAEAAANAKEEEPEKAPKEPAKEKKPQEKKKKASACC